MPITNKINKVQRDNHWFWQGLAIGKMRRHRLSEQSIGPALAEEILSRNIDHNRKIVKSRVDSYAADILSGNFMPTDQNVISISNTGKLIDGQHRLKAVLQANKPMVCNVAFGCPEDDYRLLDRGAPRRSSDDLRVLGFGSTTLLASMAKKLLEVERKPKTACGTSEVTRYFETLNHDIADAAVRFGRRASGLCQPTAVSVAYYWIMIKTQKDVEFVDVFFERFLAGDNLSANDPILKLRNKLVKKSDFGVQFRKERVVKVAAAIILAWNDHANGRSSRQQVWSHTYSLPDVA